MSNKSTHWRTPSKIYGLLNMIVGGFLVDAAADSTNHLHENWYGPGSPLGEDALEVEQWLSPAFCNPPYQHLDQWCEKFIEQSQKGVTIVALLPARTDTKWWYDGVVVPGASIGFVKGRIQFEDPTDKGRVQNNHGSAVVVYGPEASGVVSWIDLDDPEAV